jgi:DNA-binding beta-propeller fold protein YncE
VAAPAGTMAGTHDGTAVFAYQYTRNSDSSPFYIVWREDVTGNVTLSVPGTNYHVTNLVPDRFGTFQESDITASSGSITVSAGSQPLLIVPSPSPAYLLVTQLSGSGVYKVDPATNLVSSQLTFGTNVGRPAADLSRRIAWLPLGSQLLALKPDTMTYSTLTVIGLGNDGTFAAISPDGRTLAVVNHGADGLRSADDRLDIVTLNPDVWPPTASLNFTVTVGQQPIRTLIGHNGRYAVVSVRDDAKILVIDLTTQQTALQITLPAGSEPEGMDLSPTQNIAYVTLHGTNKIEIIDLGTAPPREIGSVAIQSGKGSPQPSGGHFTPDGTRFYISGQVTNEILLFNTATITAPVQDTGVSLATGTQPHDIAFLPDGRAYVANTNNGQPHGSLSIIQNYTGTPSVSGQVLTDVIINPLYMGYFPAVP